jgi:hypothetical protein
MMNDSDFYRELGRVPGLPPGLYGTVRGRVRGRALFSRVLIAAAALFIVSAGTTGVMLAVKTQKGALSPEAVAELKTVHSYLSGTDLETEYESYALLYGETVQE